MHILKKISFTVLLFVATIAFAQKGGPAVFTVEGDTVWGAEFERVFSKNNRTPDKKPSMEDLQEYLDLYVRFKLKVKEAYDLGMDTNRSFRQELAGYRKQLAQPYLTDKSITEKLIQEAYERMGQEVEASNLMIHLSPAASPKDTLEAYNRINKWREMILSGKYTFEQITRDSSTDDHGRKNEGRLGYFTAFSMIYAFENKAYNTKIGNISEAFRTQYGYHVVKVTDKRKSRGDLKVAHILIRVNNESEYEKNKPRIDAIYERLKNGEKFETLVKDFSEDFATREAGGQLNWIKSVGGGVPKDFKEASYSLKDGEYSTPVKTELGWHIIKRIEEKKMPELKDVKETIKYKIGRDSRSELNKEAVLKRVKIENNYNVNLANWNQYKSTFTDTTFLYNWNPTEAQKAKTTIFTIGDKRYTFGDFSKYLKQSDARKPNQSVASFADDMFEKYSTDKNLEYEESILETKYDDFKYLMQEYRDGILLFELSNKTVWNKASEDTAGLQMFYDKNKTNYVWKERVETKSYVCSSKKASKLVKKMLKKDSSDKAILTAVNKTDALGVNIVYKTYEQGQDSIIDGLDWTKNLHKIKDEGTNNIIFIQMEKILLPGQKELKETLGPVTSDYQKYLEGKWISRLKDKYDVEIFDGALELLFSNK